MDLTNWMHEEIAEEAANAEPETAGRAAGLPWCEKYRPASVDDIAGNESPIKEARRWADEWDRGTPKRKALIIHGAVGVGKTSLAYALAKDHGWEILEMNASDKRSKELVQKIAGLGSQTKSFTGKRKAILVEEIEGLSGMADRGASKALVEVIKESRSPVILTCNDIKNKKLGSIQRYCGDVSLKGIAPGTMVKRLGRILEGEGIKVGDIGVLQDIADNSGGDLRSAINDLQAMAEGERVVEKDGIFLEQRDRPIDVYKAMQRIFRCGDYSECRRVLWSLDEEPRNFIAWLDENIPVEYKTPSERGRAFNQLSRADIFLGRVTNRQYWGFLRYVNDLMSVGVGFSKDKPNFDFNKYRFPSLIWKMGRTRSKRAKEASIASKVSPIVHESRREIIVSYLPLLRRVFDAKPEAGMALVEGFGLESDELEYFD